MKLNKLVKVGVVVRDLDAALESYAKVFGIDSWVVNDYTDDRLSNMVAHGRRSAGTFRSAVGVTRPPGEGCTPLGAPFRPVTFELVQPVSGESVFNEFLRTRAGEGICFLTVQAALPEDSATDAVDQHFADLRIDNSFAFTVDGRTKRRFWDTQRHLGGFFLEVLTEDLEIDGQHVRPAAASSVDGTTAVPVQGVSHFGVVVPDVVAVLPNYSRIFGIDQWAMQSWETEPGRLDAPHYRGEAVNHAYFTGTGIGEDFGFEVIQPTSGPSHYGQEFMADRGPGIHHILTYMTDSEEDWAAVGQSFEKAGAEVCMGSEMGYGAGVFAYHDTFEQLHGFLIETVLVHPELAAGAPPPFDYVVNFAQTVGV
ncbi:VOC family protein [Mycolicibacterium elephantis]